MCKWPGGFEATVIWAERATYSCHREDQVNTWGRGACLLAPNAVAPACPPGELRIELPDGTTRVERTTAPKVFSFHVCDLAAGRHVATICTPDGPMPCQVDLVEGRAVGLAAMPSIYPIYRYVVRADKPVPELGAQWVVVVSDEVTLQVGDRMRFAVWQTLTTNGPKPPALPLKVSWCDVRPVEPPPPPPSGGCASCGARTGSG